MSNALAIAAVTTMLDYLITQALARSLAVSLESVTAKPPDKARDSGESTNQINIFLYQTLPNAAWRNQDIPSRVKPGETGRPPLALTLSYLITAYGKNNDDIEGQRLLGMAMQILHDHPEIRPQDIEQAQGSANLSPDQQELLVSSNLKNQVDRVRITPQVLSVEEVSKMWATFQTAYRISAAYEVSVVLIESELPVKAALPVVAVGDDNRGGRVQADLIPPIAAIEGLSWPSQQQSRQQSITLGEPLTLRGHHLNNPGSAALVRLSNPYLSAPVEIALPSTFSAKEVTVSLSPDASPDWVAGFYTVALRYQPSGSPSRNNQFSNAQSLAIAPTVDPAAVNVDADRLALTCSPPVQPGQSVSLLLGSREIALPRDPDEAEALTQLSFPLDNIQPGDYWVRLRVDGVDSHLVTRSGDGKLEFNPAYRVTVPEDGN